MAVPVTVTNEVKDRTGRSVTVGSKVRIAGMPEPVEVYELDSRYGSLVVLVPGRANQHMGLMVHAEDVELA
ncbi:MAG TPA: hypothetical protein VEZ44_00750 [bacterium]|nr:hypothetical protein [bacterium]